MYLFTGFGIQNSESWLWASPVSKSELWTQNLDSSILGSIMPAALGSNSRTLGLGKSVFKIQNSWPWILLDSNSQIWGGPGSHCQAYFYNIIALQLRFQRLAGHGQA